MTETRADMAKAMWLRVALVTLVGVIVGIGAGHIFDRAPLSIAAAAIPPALVVGALAHRTAWLRVGASIVAIAGVGLIAIIDTAGLSDALGNLGAAFTTGPNGLISTEWPSPLRADLVGTVALALAAASTLATELATRPRFHLSPLLPWLACYLATVALSSPRGIDWAICIALCVVAVVFALFHPGGSLSARIALLRGEQRLIPIAAVVTALSAAVIVPLSFTARADPRRTDPPHQTATILDPIQATLALRDLEPVVTLHEITNHGDAPLPTRWRTAALTDYDGDRWRPDLAIRPIGSTLGTATGPTVDVDITFERLDLTLVPLPGPPVRVDAAVATDRARTVVTLLDQPTLGEAISVVAERSPALGDLAGAIVAGRLVDDDVAALGELAAALAGDGSPLEQLTRMASVMRNDFVLDDGVQGGGLQRAFIERFLRDTRRGNTEQFVTGYVLLARSLGFDVRVATGFVATEADADTVALRSIDATVWPEVNVGGGRWVAFDPVPEQQATDDTPQPPIPQTQTPAAPQPPVAPPPESDTEPEPIERPDEVSERSQLATVLIWAGRGALGTAVVLLPFLVATTWILVTKRRRRHRRLTAQEPTERVRGAWASATDALVDAGMTISSASTDTEIALTAEPLVADASHELRRLATLSSAATFGTLSHPALLADDASACLSAVEASITAGRTRRQRLAWHLSLRSLRRATRSPVTT